MKKVIFLLCCHLMPLHGQDILDSDLRLAGKVLREVFVEQKKALNDWSVAIYGGENGRLASLFGTVVSSDGYILTKASDFQKIENVSLRVGGEKIEKYATVAVSEVWDVLLLKIEAEGLSAVELDEEADLSVGTWVISNGGTSRRERRAKAGIISANSRQIASKDRPFIGIIVDREAEVDGLLLKDTSEGAGAREAGLKKGDIIKKLGDYELKDFSDLIDSLSGKKVGAIVEIEFDRDGEKKAVQVNAEISFLWFFSTRLCCLRKVWGGP